MAMLSAFAAPLIPFVLVNAPPLMERFLKSPSPLATAKVLVPEPGLPPQLNEARPPSPGYVVYPINDVGAPVAPTGPATGPPATFVLVPAIEYVPVA